MAHKTLINGTAYEITGGRTLVNGTGYSIDKGKTLDGGTAYEVGFAPAMLTMTIKWESGGYSWFDHSELGEEISDGTYEVSPGSVLTCWGSSNLYETYWDIYVNGERQYATYIRSGYNTASWTYTITGNITVTYSGYSNGTVQYIYITEE